MLEQIKSRRSTRKYLNKPVPDELLSQVIEAGRYAPSAKNRQLTHFIVITDPAVLRRLRELVEAAFAKREETPGMDASALRLIRRAKAGDYPFFYEAPVLIVTANRADSLNRVADCACAIENMMLMANALDLGSCWINQLRRLNEDPDLLAYERTVLGLAENERVYGSLALGYPDTPDGLPLRTPAPRTGNEVTYIR